MAWWVRATAQMPNTLVKCQGGVHKPITAGSWGAETGGSLQLTGYQRAPGSVRHPVLGE